MSDSLPPLKFHGSSLIHRELQNTACFLGYESIFRLGDSTTELGFQKLLYNKYHGDPTDMDSVGLAEQLVKGNSVFRGMYIEETTTVTDSNIPQRDGCTLVLKPLLHCIVDKRISVGNEKNGISLSLLSATAYTNRANISGRTLQERCKLVLKNCKKALALISHHSSPYKSLLTTGTFPSGLVWEDYLLYARHEMWKEHFAKKPTDVMEDYWLFPGYFVFALFGPILPSDATGFQSELIKTSISSDDMSPNKKKSLGRKAARVEKAAVDAHARNHDNTRGQSTDNRLKIAKVAHAKALLVLENKKQDNEDIRMFHRDKLMLLTQQIDENFRMIAICKDVDPTRVKEIFERLIILQEQKNEAGLALNAAQQIIIDAEKPSELTGATAIVDNTLDELAGPATKKTKTVALPSMTEYSVTTPSVKVMIPVTNNIPVDAISSSASSLECENIGSNSADDNSHDSVGS